MFQEGVSEKGEVGTMIKKLALLMSVFFIFDRVMYYKIKQGYTHSKFVNAEVRRKPLGKDRKARKRFAAHIGKRRSATGRKMPNVVKA